MESLTHLEVLELSRPQVCARTSLELDAIEFSCTANQQLPTMIVHLASVLSNGRLGEVHIVRRLAQQLAVHVEVCDLEGVMVGAHDIGTSKAASLTVNAHANSVILELWTETRDVMDVEPIDNGVALTMQALRASEDIADVVTAGEAQNLMVTHFAGGVCVGCLNTR